MYTLTVRAAFEAAHALPMHTGKCASLHGHSYRVEAEFSGDELNETGMLCDFGDLRSVLSEILPDHTFLNEVLPCPTTAECIAQWLYDRLAERGLPVSAVTLWETEHYGCRYSQGANG
jgi:6-pyruvoyltetrahydropterin/6-carboxytetrahydropterin synthase